MNIEETIFNNLVTVLNNAMQPAQTLAYVKALGQGNEDRIITGAKPYILINPRNIKEDYRASRWKKEMLFEIEVTGVIDVPSISQIVESASGKGILRLDVDIKNVIDNDLTLSGAVLKLNVYTDRLENIGNNTWATRIIVETMREFTKGLR